MHVLIEVHHLESIELSGHLPDSLLLIIWDRLDVRSVPLDASEQQPITTFQRYTSPLDVFTIALVLLWRDDGTPHLLSLMRCVLDWTRHDDWVG